jgi:hypothetical protein
MLRFLLRLLGVDLDYQIAEIRAQIEEFRAKTTRGLAEQAKKTGLTIGFAAVGGIAAIATFVIVLVALYRWADLYGGPFAGLAAVGVVTGLLAAVMFVLAFWRGPRKPASAGSDGGRTAAPAPPRGPPHRPPSALLSAALPSLPSNASVVDVLKHRVSTHVAGAGDEAIDAAVHLMRTGSRSVVFGTLAVVALVGVLLGRRR